MFSRQGGCVSSFYFKFRINTVVWALGFLPGFVFCGSFLKTLVLCLGCPPPRCARSMIMVTQLLEWWDCYDDEKVGSS